MYNASGTVYIQINIYVYMSLNIFIFYNLSDITLLKTITINLGKIYTKRQYIKRSIKVRYGSVSSRDYTHK